MIEIGKLNTLEIIKDVDFGLYLRGDESQEILLPREYRPKTYNIGDEIEVFIYRDSEDRIIATTLTPKVQVDEFAYLKVIMTNQIGAFLDWGLPKDLFVPFREQQNEMIDGQFYVVRTYLDERTKRIVASSRLNLFLDDYSDQYNYNQVVKVMIAEKTDLGYKVIVDDDCWGLIYNNEIYQKIELGQVIKAYIKKPRQDGKIDVVLEKPGYDKVTGHALTILNAIEANKGFLAITDKSEPELIYSQFSMSKKTFKKAIGSLFKNRFILIEEDGIKLTESYEIALKKKRMKNV
jgi:uncharacterized protein